MKGEKFLSIILGSLLVLVMGSTPLIGAEKSKKTTSKATTEKTATKKSTKKASTKKVTTKKTKIKKGATKKTKIKKGATKKTATKKRIKVNINTADIETLMLLNGVGENLAKKIVNYRKKNGRFKKPEDLMKVKGIGEKTFENNKDIIVVK